MRSTSREDFFHNQASIYLAMQNQRAAMSTEINSLPAIKLKAAPLEQTAQAIAEKFSINIPVLDETGVRPHQREVDIDISNDPTRRAFYGDRQVVQKGTSISITVPFTGDAPVFRLYPSNHTMQYPPGRIEASTIVFQKVGTNLDPAHVRREFDEWIAIIKQHLAGMLQELGGFNEAIRGEALSALTARAEKLRRDDALLSGLGFGPAGASS